MIFYYFSVQTRRQPKLNKDQILEMLRDSLTKNKEAVNLVKKIDKLIKCSKNNIFTLAYQQGIVFHKFKKNSKFVNTVTEFDISKTTINFNIDIVNFIDQYPGMRKSSISLFYLKHNFRRIKTVCQEHVSEFQ